MTSAADDRHDFAVWMIGNLVHFEHNIDIPALADKMIADYNEENTMGVNVGPPEYYQDKAGEWRWRVRGANNEIIDASTQGFDSHRNAKNNYELGQLA